MLADMISKGFGNAEDLNCAEKILWGANQAYNLGLDPEALKLASGFGGGMGIGSVCGAVAASVMVLGRLFVKERAHEDTRIKALSQEFIKSYHQEMRQIMCNALKARYRTEEKKCYDVIFKAAQLLDCIVMRELAKDQSGLEG